MRWLIGTPQDWNVFFQRAFDSLASGGWLESYEMSAIIESDDGSVKDDMACMSFPRFRLFSNCFVSPDSFHEMRNRD